MKLMSKNKNSKIIAVIKLILFNKSKKPYLKVIIKTMRIQQCWKD